MREIWFTIVVFMDKNLLQEIVGWYGTVILLLAYALVSFNVLSSSSLMFQAMNASGALAIVYPCLKKKDYQPVVLNMVWGLVALVALVRILFS